jgi:hypothetical protein
MILYFLFVTLIKPPLSEPNDLPPYHPVMIFLELDLFPNVFYLPVAVTITSYRLKFFFESLILLRSLSKISLILYDLLSYPIIEIFIDSSIISFGIFKIKNPFSLETVPIGFPIIPILANGIISVVVSRRM